MLRDYERGCLISILEQWGTPTHLLPTEITNESGQGGNREALYAIGGVFLISSRILIVDLLTGVASPKYIDGILVAHAENISEQSTEAFILRIFKNQARFRSYGGCNYFDASDNSQNNPIIQSHQNGFVKAFSDNPESLMSGFSKVEKVLKALFVKGLYLYPRFHEHVIKDLQQSPPIVEQFVQNLSPRMADIQASIAAAIVVRLCVVYTIAPGLLSFPYSIYNVY